MSTSNDTRNFTYTLAANSLERLEGTFHGAFVSRETIGLDRFAARVAKANPPLRAAAVRTILAATFAEVSDIVADGLFRVSLDGLVFEAAISGSLPSANASLGEGNEVYVAVRLPDSLKTAASGITPKRADAKEVAAALDAVGMADGRKPGEISATGDFLLVGENISATGDGEGVQVEFPDGTKVDMEASDDSGQRITAHHASALPLGSATVLLTTCGYRTPEGEPHTYSKKVTIVAGDVPPTPTGPTVTAINDGTFHDGSNVVTGAGMRFSDLWSNGDRKITVTHSARWEG